MFNGKVVRRTALFAMVGLFTLGPAVPALAGTLTQVAYYPAPGTGVVGGMLIDWQSATRVRLVNDRGAQLGTASRSGPPWEVQTVVTLAGCADLDAHIQQRAGQLRQPTGGASGHEASRRAGHRERIAAGTSQMIEIGTLTDAGTSMKRVAMVARLLSLDVLPGVQLAGFSEQQWF